MPSLRRRRYSTPVSVAVTPTSATIAVAGTQQLTATVVVKTGASRTDFTAGAWSTSNAGRATVSASGLVTGVATGAAANLNFTTTFLSITDASPTTITVS